MRIVLDQASNFFKASMEELEADLKTGDVARYTKDELDGFQNSVKSTSQWLEDGLKKQASLAENVDPVLKRLDLEAKAKTLTAEIEKLSKKRRPRVSTSNTSAPESTTQTTSSSSTSSSDSSETQHPRDEL